ncbi:MAG: arginase [Anaerolineae bacterium]
MTKPAEGNSAGLVRILGVPMDLGQSRRGVDMGPSALRYAGLQARLEHLRCQVCDHGNLTVPTPEEAAARWGQDRTQAVASVCDAVYRVATSDMTDQDLALFLGGDHSISIGSVAAAAAREPVGLIWIDAHGDFNTPATSPSGNVHGMSVAVLTGDGAPALVDLGFAGAKVKPECVVQIAIRDLDPEERRRLVASPIHVFTMRDVDETGIGAVARRAVELTADLPRLHVSLDLDSLDPTVAPGVGTPVPGGLSYREAHLLMEILGDSGRVSSADLVEINPILDSHNATARMGVELAASLLGQRIL